MLGSIFSSKFAINVPYIKAYNVLSRCRTIFVTSSSLKNLSLLIVLESGHFAIYQSAALLY